MFPLKSLRRIFFIFILLTQKIFLTLANNNHFNNTNSLFKLDINYNSSNTSENVKPVKFVPPHKPIEKPQINKNAKKFSLPIGNVNKNETTKILERLQASKVPKVSNLQNQHTKFSDIFNYDAYILKPFKFDYSKIFPTKPAVHKRDSVKRLTQKPIEFGEKTGKSITI